MDRENHKNWKPNDNRVLLGTNEVAEMCGVSPRTWYRLRSAGKVPSALKVGSLTKWRRIDVEQWIADGCPDVNGNGTGAQ